MKQRKSLILIASTLLLSGPTQAAVVGDSVEGYMYTTSTLSSVVTQLDSPVVVDNTGLPEFTGNFHYEYNTTSGPEIYEFDLMLDIGDNYFEFDLSKFIAAYNGKNSLVAVYDIGDPQKASQFGVVRLAGYKIAELKEKPAMVPNPS